MMFRLPLVVRWALRAREYVERHVNDYRASPKTGFSQETLLDPDGDAPR